MSEPQAAPKAQFVYKTYIRATPEAVWAGLTEPEFTRQYWIHDNVSDWQVGSRWEHRRSDGSDILDIEGEVVESDPPRKLVVSWVQPKHQGDPVKTSRVTFSLDQEGLEAWPGGPWTRLTIAHTDMEAGGEMHLSVSEGWPMVACGLKTLLEVGSLERES